MDVPVEPEQVPEPPPARAAATIVLARTSPDAGGVEVLVLRRGAASRFVPGLVFPGGSIDQDDAALAERWFGSVGEAARACAVRELAEEAGLLIEADGVIEARSVPDPFVSPPPVERLPQIGHWIAPAFLPMRFDARFFAAPFDGGARAVPDGIEAADAWWARPGDLLDGQREGTVQLAWPTFKTLEALAACATVDDVLALRIEQVPPPIPSHVAPRPSR